MKSAATPTSGATAWYGAHRPSWRFTWRAVLWFLIFPARGQRTGLTLSGILLVGISVAIGSAAYNSANNILFLTLSLLLGCLILSGVLSWLNFRGLRWRLEVDPPLRVGQDHAVTLVVRNQKNFIPSYGIWFELKTRATEQSFELPMRSRLDPGDEMRLQCTFRPEKHGWETLEVTHVGSLFPFGFLRKSFAVNLTEKMVIWPAPVEYRRFPVAAWQRTPAGETVRRPGEGGDLIALRRYQFADSHRQIHWKASARLRQLLVRQTAAEAGEGFSLWIDLSAERWTREEQFELLCRFAATLAEDLFTADKLRAVGLGREPLASVRRLRDLEQFLDRIATAKTEALLVTPVSGKPLQTTERSGHSDVRFRSHRNLLTFAPDGPRGVAAYIHGEKTAAT